MARVSSAGEPRASFRDVQQGASRLCQLQLQWIAASFSSNCKRKRADSGLCAHWPSHSMVVSGVHPSDSAGILASARLS